MNTIVSLLTTTDGRIGRQQWWTGVIALSVIAFVANTTVIILARNVPLLAVISSTLVILALLWPAYCVGFKLRHDRGNKGTDLGILLGGMLLLNLIQIPRMYAILSDNPGIGPAIWMQILGLGWTAFAIYMFVQLGILKGTSGPNAYGLDPLDGAA